MAAVLLTYRAHLAWMCIPARVAYGLACIERAAVAEGLVEPVLDDALDLLWRYCSLENATPWVEAVDARLMNVQAHASFLYDGRVPEDRMADDDPLRVLPDAYILAINECIIAATCELYVAMDGISERSIVAILEVIDWLGRRGVTPPAIEPFLAHPFGEHGWGRPFDPAPLRDPVFLARRRQ